jgi:Holliday junction resolvase RusA-like endonuclease
MGLQPVIKFFVPLAVVPKNKRRAFGPGIIVDDPRSVDNAKTLAALFWEHRPAKPLEGPVTVSYRFQARWRKPDLKKRAKGKLPDTMPRDTGPDLGNLTKQADDVLKKCGFVVDDRQIWNYGGTCKVWADQAGVWVSIEEWKNGNKP